MSCIGVRRVLVHALFLSSLVLCFGVGLLSDVERVNGLLRRAESNLSSVASSIGHRTTPPTGSAAKLAGVRLQSALDDLNPAKDLLEKIPADAAGREEAAARYTAAAEEYNRLRAILTGSDAPAPTPSEDGVKLDYKQEELLKGAEFHIREVEGNAAHLIEQIEQMRGFRDQLSINFRDVMQLRGVVENARRKTGFARDSLAQLPADGRGVPEANQRLVNADAKVGTAAQYLDPLHNRLQDLINPENYPEFDADRKRLRELSVMFGNPQILETNRPLAGETYTQSDAALAECVRIAQKYARLIQQQTEQGKTIEGISNGFMRSHGGFVAAAEGMQETLPGEIQADLEKARQYATEAVVEQKPLWFTGGIPQVMGYAEERVELLGAIDATAGAHWKGELEATRAQLKEQADSLRELIIRENTMPPDRFAGDDRDKAVETAISGWKVQQPEFELLAVRIPSEQWARETKWTYSNGTWYFSDRSKLQVRLIVADHGNPELAIDRPVNVFKDHQKGDTLIGVPLWGFEDELQPNDYMLRSKVK